MILKKEKKLIEWVEKNAYTLGVIVSFLISLLIRVLLRDFQSGDAENALLPWYEALKNEGGFSTLYRQVGDYNIPYQTVLAFLTYLPIKPLYAIKIVSVIFDYVLALSITWMVYLLSEKNRNKALLCLAVSMNFPIFIMNSSLWGQCDSIFSSFCVLSLCFFFKEKDIKGFIFLGLGFAFKLQAVFFLPFIIFYYLYKRRFSVMYFLIVPLTMWIASIGGVVRGRGMKEIIYIYWKQTEAYPYVSLGYSSFWNLFLYPSDSASTYYPYIGSLAIGLTVLTLGWIIVSLLKKNLRYTNISLLGIAYIMTYTCVFLLPRMHERYDYIYIVLGLIIIFVNKKYLPSFIVTNYLCIRCYSGYLFGNNVTNWNLFSMINLIAYAYTLTVLYKDIREYDNNATIN